MEICLNLKAFSPEITLTVGLVVLFLADAAFPKVRQNWFPLWLIGLTCLGAALCTASMSAHMGPQTFFSGLVIQDRFTDFFRYFFFFSCAAGAYIAYGSRELREKGRTEFGILLLCTTFGLSLMAMANHLLTLYLGIETVSIVSFAMSGLRRDDPKANEASFKYLVYGAMASGLMIYGFSLLYGLTGSLEYSKIAQFLATQGAQSPFILGLAVCLVYAGLAYKISAFPMHFWTPDVYEGAPTPVATFFSVGPKAAGFAALVRVMMYMFSTKGEGGAFIPVAALSLSHWIAVISALTMIVGNLSAIGQRSTKRLLAYSSIAHVGYMLMGLVAINSGGLSSILFYLIAYCAMNLGAFWIVCIVSDSKRSDDLTAFRGVGWQSPLLGVCMSIFLFSLTGIPMFSGFIGKFLLFASVLKTPGFLWLAVIGVLNSVVSLYYYLKILKAMWLEKPSTSDSPTYISLYHGWGLVALAIPTIILGLFFGPALRLAERTLASLL